MKKCVPTSFVAVLFFIAGLFVSSAFAKQKQQPGYILEHEKDIAAAEPGSAIGYHLQKEEEIYYIASGTGEMAMNGETFMVQAGDAILTLAGSSHGLKQTGNDDLIVIINYEKK